MRNAPPRSASRMAPKTLGASNRRGAEPVDRPVHADQRRRAQVADQAVALDGPVARLVGPAPAPLGDHDRPRSPLRPRWSGSPRARGNCSCGTRGRGRSLRSPRDPRSEALTETAFGALVIILAGALARHFRVLSREDGPALVRIVIYLGLPPLIFLIISRADLTGALLLIPVGGLRGPHRAARHRDRLDADLGNGADPGRRPHPRGGGRQHRLLRAPADRGLGGGLLAGGGGHVRRRHRAHHVDIDRRGRERLRPRARRSARLVRPARRARCCCRPTGASRPGWWSTSPAWTTSRGSSSARWSCWRRRSSRSPCSTPAS